MFNIILVILFILWGLCAFISKPEEDYWEDYEDYENESD